MRAVVKYLIIPLLVLFAGDRTMGIILDRLYLKNHCNYNEGALNEYLAGVAPDTLIVGTSRAIHMIIPDSIGKSVRVLGQQQKNLFYHHSVISLLAQHRKLPRKVLILNIEVSDLYLENAGRLLQQVSSLSYFYNKNEVVKSYINRIGSYEPIKYLSSLYRHNSNGVLLFTNPLQNICPSSGDNGYIPLQRGPLDSVRTMNGLKEDAGKYNYNKINPEFKNSIHKIKKLCDANSIELIVLNGPYFKPFPNMIKASGMVSGIVIGENIKYFDFVRRPKYRYKSTALWYDHIHLNHEGAKVYSRDLGVLLKESAAENRSVINKR